MNTSASANSGQDLARVFRAESGRILAALISQYNDIDLAEDALQDACLSASTKWPNSGIPRNPAAWLITVARRRLIDRLRQLSRAGTETVILAIAESLKAVPIDHQLEAPELENEQLIPDERLKLIFTCCHPALSEEARVALTLRTLCGLNAGEIARAFLVAESTLQQRLSRAKSKIKRAGIAYQVPEKSELANRLPSVLEVIYLIFNESYSAYEGQSLTREELGQEAIRLARVLYNLLPHAEVAGLLALLLLHHARSAARSNSTNAFIPLEQQDRALWDQLAISEGRKILLAAMTQNEIGKYQIQAAISALHAEAKSWQETDWRQIFLLYQALHNIEKSPVVELNMAVALANAGDEKSAMEKILGLAESLKNYQPYYAAAADISMRLGTKKQARQHYNQAIALSKNNAERDFLKSKLLSL